MKSRFYLVIGLTSLLLLPAFKSVDRTDEFSQADTYEYLRYLCKTWGFIKYFHPSVSYCYETWDEELMSTIPEVLSATNDDEFNNILRGLLDKAGVVPDPTDTLPYIEDSLRFNLDTDWINSNPIFAQDVAVSLSEIRDKFRPQKSCWMRYFGAGNANYSDDARYYSNSPQYPDLPMRMLALFRYWNIVRYFSPYNNILDQDWEETLVEFIPRMAEASNALEYHLAFKEMTVKLDDAHNFFSSPTYSDWYGGNYTPFEVKYVDGETVISQVIKTETKVKIGDVIKKIDGEDIYKRRAKLWKYAHGGNDPVKNRNLNRHLLSGKFGSFELEIENSTGTKTVSLSRQGLNSSILASQAERGEVYWDTITPQGCRFLYVHMGILESFHLPKLAEKINISDAVIFDVRNYPNGVLWDLVDYLYPGPVQMASFTIPALEFPGTLYWVDPSIGEGTISPYQGKLILLFNEDSQSHAEYTIMGLEQHPGAIKIGSTTAGADGNVSQIFLPGGIRTNITGLGVFYPDHTPTQRVGIIPDHFIRPTIEGIREGRDEVLDLAFKIASDSCTLVHSNDLNAFSAPPNIFPNPFSNELSISWEKPFSGTLALYDLQGSMIRSKDLSGARSTDWALGDLAKGAYIIRIVTEDHIYTDKLIRQ